ncbi:MAG: hypothetical protein EXR68_01630 [Dehalococcoidia bacterium]|nr:hypothetical protein [Dehalococcoidia bacterium]
MRYGELEAHMDKVELRAWMMERRWHIHALAAELGIHPSTLQRYRTGELAVPKVVELALKTLEDR